MCLQINAINTKTIPSQTSFLDNLVSLHPSAIGQCTCVAAVMDTTKDGRLEQLKLTKRPSANKTIRLPSGQITWSTCDRTFSHVRSGVRRLFCGKLLYMQYYLTMPLNSPKLEKFNRQHKS
jgi:hypothetical protein